MKNSDLLRKMRERSRSRKMRDTIELARDSILRGLAELKEEVPDDDEELAEVYEAVPGETPLPG